MATPRKLCDDTLASLGVGGFVVANESELRARIVEMQAEHQALETAIHALQEAAAPDLFALRRLKKRKLQLKDAIARMRSRLIPDLNA
jgi:hypothetical protein